MKMKHLKKYDSYNIESTTGNKVIYYFETAQGSKYLITDKGETKRWKSVHSNTGGDDKGLKDWYQKSFFVEPKFEYEANSIQFLIGNGFKTAIYIKQNEATIYVVKDNKWVIGNMKDAYPKSNIDRELKFNFINKPTIGYNITEYNLNSDNFSIKNYHFGSEVTKIIDADKITDEEIKHFKK